MPAATNPTAAANAAVGDLVSEPNLSVAQHRFLSRWPDVDIRRRWARRADLPGVVVQAALSGETDAQVLSTLLAGPATCEAGHRRLYTMRGVRLQAIANAYRRHSDDPAVLEQLCRGLWCQSKTRFPVELAEAGVTIDQLPCAAAEGMVRFGAPRDVTRTVHVHRHHPAVRAAWARRILSYPADSLPDDAHRLWEHLPGLPDESHLTGRLVRRAERLAAAGYSWPGELVATLTVAADPAAIRALIDTAGGNTNRILAALRTHRHRRPLLVRAVLDELDRDDPSGVAGFMFVLAAHKDDQHAGHLTELRRRVRAVGTDMTVVQAKAAALARSSQATFGSQPADVGRLLCELLEVNVGVLPALVDQPEDRPFAANDRFVAAIRFERLDPAVVATFAARDDLLGAKARASSAITDDMILDWPLREVSRDEHLWKRFVRHATGQLEPWQLLLVIDACDCPLTVRDAVAAVAAL